MNRVLSNIWPVWHYPFTAALSTLRQDHNFHPLNQRRINLQDIQIRRGSPLTMINASLVSASQTNVYKSYVLSIALF